MLFIAIVIFMMEDKEDEHRLENKLQAWQLGRVNLLLVQMGRALGLFEVLFEQGPLTVEELAQATELQERSNTCIYL